ncbi:MAG: hypothetical protein II669_02225 [Elusimicrobia bacterium]|nr:hypothetical protein [Elusimicrobiota bacterium]
MLTSYLPILSINNRKRKMSKDMIKEIYIGKKYDCKCQRCGKEVHGKKAHMHHLSSRTKLGNMANLWGTEIGKKEVKKTVLLCDECHTLLHKILGKVVTIKQSKQFIYGK